MKYISTRSKEKEYSFGEVFLKGLADDGGLYVPKSIKKYNSAELSELKKLNYNKLSTEIINQFLGDFISKEKLLSLINKSYSTFREKEVVKISNVGGIILLELLLLTLLSCVITLAESPPFWFLAICVLAIGMSFSILLS